MELFESLFQCWHCHLAFENLQSSNPIVYKSYANPNTARLACSSNSYTSGIISQQTRTTERDSRAFPVVANLSTTNYAAASVFSATFALFQVELTIPRSQWVINGNLTAQHGCLS